MKGYVLVVKIQFFIFFRKDERKRINVRAFSTLRIGQSCHTRSTFDERVFRQNSVFIKCGAVGCFWAFLEGGFGRFRRDFDGFVIIMARNPDENCCQGVN